MEHAPAPPSRTRLWLSELAPERIKERLARDAASRSAAAKMLAAIGMAKEHGRDASESLLNHAWDACGKAAFEAAMAERCWAPEPSALANFFDHGPRKLATPAEAVAMMPTAWARKLAPMVPSAHWTHRTKACDAWEWSPDSAMGKLSALSSIGPMLRFCARAASQSNEEAMEMLDLLSSHVGVAGMDEGMACIQLLQRRHGLPCAELVAKIRSLAQASDVARSSPEPAREERPQRSRL